MKNFILILFAMCILIPEAHALKSYSYDSDGKRVYQTVQGRYQPTYNNKSNRVLTYSKGANGRTYVYDSNGNRLKTYSKGRNGRTYVYDSNGNRIRSYSTASNGRTYVYGPDGQRIRTYSRAKNGRTYVYENGINRIANRNSGGTRTFVTTNNRAYSHQFKGTGGSFSTRPIGGGTRIVSTNRALYRYSGF